MYDYVTPEKILNALRWLKGHNPLYANIEINEEWVLDAENDDLDLYTSLSNNTESDPPTDIDSSEVAIVDINSEPCIDSTNPVDRASSDHIARMSRNCQAESCEICN